MTDNFEASIDPKDMLEFHIAMEHLDPGALLKDEWRGFLVPMKRELREYPPKLPDQKYIRTFHLRESWQYKVLSPTEAQMQNLAVYAGWVQGVAQAPIHENRWKKAVEVAEEHLERLVKKLADKAGKVWER